MSVASRLVARARPLLPALIYLTATVLSRLAGIILIPLYTRRLDEVAYGELAIAQTLQSLMPTLLTFGLATALPKFYFSVTDPAEARKLAGSIARSTVLVALASAGLVQLGLALLAPRTSGALGLHGLTCVNAAVLGSSLATIPDSYLRTTQQPRLAAAFQLSQFASQTVAALVMVLVLDRGLDGALEALALGAIVPAAIGAVVAVRLGGAIDRALLVSALRFSLPFVPHLCAQWLQTAADRWVLRINDLGAELGGYALASQIASPAPMVVSAWNDAASPKLGAIARDGGTSALRSALPGVRRGYALVAIAAGLATLLAIPLVPLVVGDRWADRWHAAAPLVVFFVVLNVVDTLYFPSSNATYYAGRTGWIPFVTLSAGVAAVAVAAALVRSHGLVGVMAGRVVGSVVRSGLMWIGAARSLRAELPAESSR